MIDPLDGFPADFNIDSLSEPRDETVMAFRAVCDQVDRLSGIDEASPDPSTGEIPDIRNLYFTERTFTNGSSLVAHSVQGSEEYLDAWGQTEPIRSIELRTENGTSYTYDEYTTGQTKLLIKRPGKRVIREVNPQDVTFEADNGMSVAIKGEAEFMRVFLTSLAEQREANTMGLSKPTDGNLEELTDAIQAALDSGFVPSSTK